MFGSRVKWRARIDSDLDIAITATVGNYVRFDSDWQKKISEVTGLRGRVRHYNCPVDPAVRDYCEAGSILVFERCYHRIADSRAARCHGDVPDHRMSSECAGYYSLYERLLMSLIRMPVNVPVMKAIVQLPIQNIVASH